MRKILLGGACLLSCCSTALAQNQLDKYLTGTNTFTVVGSATQNLTAPHDLDFVPSRPNEWWVLNKEANGASVVIFYNAGKPNQSHQLRRDSHNDHFMARSVAISMGDNDRFGSAQEIKNTAAPTSTFMGPALWSSDTSIFARIYQNNWVTGQPLGSHIDMLHQSPFGMGIAHDNANVYWYFDGYNGNICKYDFSTPHGIGEDDHSDGKIYRYSSVSVTRKPNVPSHLALDKPNKWLYIVDGGGNRILRLKTDNGSAGSNLTVPSTSNEPLAEYKEWTGATMEVLVTTGLTAPSGIDVKNGRMIVSDNATGEIYLYNVSTMPVQLLGKINTGSPGVMGVRIDNANKIWFVNNTTRQLVRIDNPALAVPGLTQQISFSIYPNPATTSLAINIEDLKGSDVTNIRVSDMLGRVLYRGVSDGRETIINTSTWAKGLYSISLMRNGAAANTQVLIQ